MLSLENWLAEKFWIWRVCVRLMMLVRTVLAQARNENENVIGNFIFVVKIFQVVCGGDEYGQIIRDYILGSDKLLFVRLRTELELIAYSL